LNYVFATIGNHGVGVVFAGDFVVFRANASVAAACSLKADSTQRPQDSEHSAGPEKEIGESWRLWHFQSSSQQEQSTYGEY